MNRDDIIRMAREAGAKDYGTGEEGVTALMLREEAIERFFHMAQAHALANIDPSKFMSHQEGIEAGRFAEREAMIEQGWRQCAKGQRTTQFCGMVEQAIQAEREACAKVCQDIQDCGPENGCCPTYWNEALDRAEAAIRARGQQ